MAKTAKQLIKQAYEIAKTMPPEQAAIIKELATVLDVSNVALRQTRTERDALLAEVKSWAPAVKAAMEIAYLCAARVSDVLKMNWNQILDKGIFIQQGKTGIKQIKAWTERLHAAVDICREWGQDGPVIRTMYGERYSYKGFNEAWRKARNAASEELGRPLDCTFHDLKAKGISDYEGSGRDKQKFSGHKTESQVLVYDRKVKISPTLNKKMR